MDATAWYVAVQRLDDCVSRSVIEVGAGSRVLRAIKWSRSNLRLMPLFRVTKKLASALHATLPRAPVEASRPEHEWFADLFYVERKKCVIWAHRPTLFTFVRPAVVATELRDFHGLFVHEFKSALASMALPESLVERFGAYQPTAVAPTNDRRVVGSMLDYRKMFDFMAYRKGGLAHADLDAMIAQLNKSPMSVLGMESPIDLVRSLGSGEVH